MLLHALLSVHLVTLAATGPLPGRDGTTRMSVTEKAAAVQRHVNQATDCVVHAVLEKTANAGASADVGELIVAAMPSCADRMRAMIDSFDANYGEGSGESFFSGSYLDILPNVVNKRLSQGTP